ncbi:hypothetical protein EVAR_59243_1 [Eumeta japonica]|uniref:Uncharacterized protein n=1 Tax=Eumeta variegata TaxID=151549 RepID=A0A4C2A2N5_EUMVA|nr:hypothetical protein EVAR_59243_1 [Eumeta japonica]
MNSDEDSGHLSIYKLFIKITPVSANTIYLSSYLLKELGIQQSTGDAAASIQVYYLLVKQQNRKNLAHLGLYSLMDFVEVVPTLLTAKIFEEKLLATYRGKWRSCRTTAARAARAAGAARPARAGAI